MHLGARRSPVAEWTSSMASCALASTGDDRLTLSELKSKLLKGGYIGDCIGDYCRDYIR